MSDTSMKVLQVKTSKHNEFIDITGLVQETVGEGGQEDGVCLVYVPHTTAGVTINENADPSVRKDILMMLDKMVPEKAPYTHGEGNSPGHVKSSLMGCSAHVPVKAGRLALGTWQGIYFCEFDGPRTRQVWVQILRSK
jgi:secondary thiamine-phosphate synthase enzyme